VGVASVEVVDDQRVGAEFEEGEHGFAFSGLERLAHTATALTSPAGPESGLVPNRRRFRYGVHGLSGRCAVWSMELMAAHQRSASEELKHERALGREEAESEALGCPAPENEFLSSVQFNLEREAAARAVEDAK